MARYMVQWSVGAQSQLEPKGGFAKTLMAYHPPIFQKLICSCFPAHPSSCLLFLSFEKYFLIHQPLCTPMALWQHSIEFRSSFRLLFRTMNTAQPSKQIESDVQLRPATLLLTSIALTRGGFVWSSHLQKSMEFGSWRFVLSCECLCSFFLELHVTYVFCMPYNCNGFDNTLVFFFFAKLLVCTDSNFRVNKLHNRFGSRNIRMYERVKLE
jgi:hypothetical protein